MALCLTKYYVHGLAIVVKFNKKIVSANKIKRIIYLTSEMAESKQENCTSDGAAKITLNKRYWLGIEKVSLKGLRLFDNPVSKYFTFKTISCMQWLFWVIYQNYKEV